MSLIAYAIIFQVILHTLLFLITKNLLPISDKTLFLIDFCKFVISALLIFYTAILIWNHYYKETVKLTKENKKLMIENNKYIKLIKNLKK